MSDTAPATSLNRTSLYECHVALGARMVPFAGWEMPVQYAGILSEAKAVRTSAGVFDVSHMGRLSFVGRNALTFLQFVTTNAVDRLQPGRGQYSLLPNDIGGTIDDVILYRTADTEYRMVVNASNHDKDVRWLEAHLLGNVQMVDYTRDTVMLAVQGPAAASLLSGICDAPEQLNSLTSFGTATLKISGVDTFVARSGYTGEDGFELVCSAADGPQLWDALLSIGIVPCGLAARDTLRVEAGFPLYGHELSESLSPVSAGLKWVIDASKSFIGDEFIKVALVSGAPKRLMGIKLGVKRLVPPGTQVFVENKPVGEVTSGVVSVLYDCAIALAFVDRSVKVDTPCELDLRGKHEIAIVVDKRFYRRAP